MRQFAVLFLLLFAIYAPVSHGACDGDALLTMREHRKATLSGLRRDAVKAASAFVAFPLRGHSYQPLFLLGTSNAQAFLSKDGSGREVLVKNYLHDEIENDLEKRYSLIIREVLVTNFLTEKGIEVPAFIGFNVGSGFVVKEYVEGILASELRIYKQVFGFSNEEIEKLESEYAALAAQLAALTREFKKWLREDGLETLPPELRAFTYTRAGRQNILDIQPRNFLYSLEKQKWIFFDP